ncbi:unnamed protein product [Vitrella brassicaformis CCMP3155]|uniref:Uncharacterized protein n=1 Tax=Vitrella brassicaformis (strain CCMP3155) TaxID=1169540 RepID=A0A0G4EQL3_VITBC|nr:unnamed protein product [Vitrella brassicaformis CCMP3155]|eukprot:CEL99926.1 unnamed protein product [Vitrella brassicaformis CCMP3155]
MNASAFDAALKGAERTAADPPQMKLLQEDLLRTFNNVQSYHRRQDVQFFGRPPIPSSAATPQSYFGDSGQDINNPIVVTLESRLRRERENGPVQAGHAAL